MVMMVVWPEEWMDQQERYYDRQLYQNIVSVGGRSKNYRSHIVVVIVVVVAAAV